MSPPNPMGGAPEPFGAPPGLDEEPDEPGGGVFVASMSTEGAAAGMLQLPEELRLPEKSSSKGGGIGSTIVTVLLVLIILAAVSVAVAIFAFGWQPPFLG